MFNATLNNGPGKTRLNQIATIGYEDGICGDVSRVGVIAAKYGPVAAELYANNYDQGSADYRVPCDWCEGQCSKTPIVIRSQKYTQAFCCEKCFYEACDEQAAAAKQFIYAY